MNLTNAGLVSRRYLAGVLVPVISFGALLVSATPAFAELEEATTHDVQVVDESDLVILDSIDVVACYHSDSNQYVCMEPVASEAGVASIDLSSINLPDSTGYVHLSAGGAQNSKYSRSYSSFYVENGLANVTTDLIMNEAEWVSVEVTVLEGETPLEGAQISLSGLPVWQSALTDIAGLASFTVDVSSLDPNSVISAELDGNHTGHESRSQDVSTDGSIRTAQIVTNRSSYTLSGVIRDENQDLFSNRKVCFQWGTYPTNKQLELVTDANGGYEIDGVYGYLGLRPSKCFIHWSENLEYDYQSLSHQVLSTGTKDFNMTRTGISLLVTDGTDPIPGISVSLLQGTNTTAYNTKKTDGDGIATFYNLSPGDYTATYMLPTNPYDSARRDLVMFEENTNSVSVTSVPNETVSDYLVLTRLENVTSLHTVRGTVLGLADTPISNASVRIEVTPIPYRENANFSVDVKTNTMGAFSAVNIPSGKVSVSTYASGYRTYGVEYEANASVETYNVGAIRVRPYVLSENEYSGVVRDTRGNPIPNVNLVLWPSWDSGQLMRQETTDSQGRFRFTGLPAGQIYISTFGSNPRYKFKYFNHYLSESVTNEVLVLPDLNPTGASQTAVVSGRLLEYLDVNGPESSVPVANACLSVFPRGGGQGIQAITDSNGIWTVSGLLAGAEYYASYRGICSEGESGFPEMFDFQDKYEYLNSWDPLVAVTSDLERVDVLLKEISRSGPGSVAGRVKDAETYQNLSGFTVNIYRNSGGIQIPPVTTDERGEYSFPNLPTGEYYLSVTSGENDQGSSSYTSSTMSVEVGTTANRANVFLTRNPQALNEGVVSGTLVDEFGNPHGSAIVDIWDRNNSSIWSYDITDNDGNFSVSGLPKGVELSLRVLPVWRELAQYLYKLVIPENDSLDPQILELEEGSSITGQVSGMLSSEDFIGYPVYAELLEIDSQEVIQRAYPDWLTGRYEFTQVPLGDYFIRYTQNSPPFAPERFGDGGSGYSGTELPSLKPVYWDGTKFGTTDITEAISVESDGLTVIGKNVTMSPGSSLVGSLSIATPDGESKLTGTREITVTVLKKVSEIDWKELTYSSISGYSKSTFQIAGLANGVYKLRFSDIRRGNNALATSFNGGYSTLAEAPEIRVGDPERPEIPERVVYSHTMTAAPPEQSAEAFDLDDLGSELLDQLRDEISVSAQPDSGAELEIFVGTEFAGEYVSAFANSTPVMLGTWQQVDSRGYISVTPPSSLLAGEHRIAVQDVRGVVFGWTPVTIQKPSAAKAKATPSDSQLASPLVISNEGKQAESKPKVSLDSKPEGVIDRPGQADWYLPLSAAISLFTLAGAIWMVRARSARRLRS